MSNYINQVSDSLKNHISELANNPCLFLRNHNVDFSRKRKQEIYARLLLYNYCELITTHVIKQMKSNDKTKQVNFTIAIYICREYLRNKRNLSPPDVINLIEKHVLPVRPGRKDPRKVKPQASVSFLYRVA